MTLRTLLRAAACLLAILPSPAPADSTGRLQFLYTAFMDVRGLAANTLEHCARDNPATQAMLQDLYRDWDRNHGRHQTELQMLIRAQLVEAIGPEQAEAFIDNARMQAHKQLAPRYFPQRPVADSAYFCGKLLPQTLRGEVPMLRFGQYVREYRKETAPRLSGARLPFRASGRLLLKQTIQPPMRPAGACLNPRHPS